MRTSRELTALREWQFDVVGSTHELLREGVIEAWRARIEVAAPDYLTASLIALQMYAATISMPTNIYYVE